MGILGIPMVKTIKIQDKTHERLENIGTKSETFDDIINKLLVVYKKSPKVKG